MPIATAHTNHTTSPITVRAATLGNDEGRPRYYAQGRYLARAGFEPGVFLRLAVIGEGDRAALEVRVVAEPTGNRVSGKMLGRSAERPDAETTVRVPVIDIQSALLRDLFGDGGTVHVRVEAGRLILSRPAIERRIAARLTDGSEGSVFSGGGLLTEAARMAGFTPRFAVELDERYGVAMRTLERRHPAGQGEAGTEAQRSARPPHG